MNKALERKLISLAKENGPAKKLVLKAGGPKKYLGDGVWVRRTRKGQLVIYFDVEVVSK